MNNKESHNPYKIPRPRKDERMKIRPKNLKGKLPDILQMYANNKRFKYYEVIMQKNYETFPLYDSSEVEIFRRKKDDALLLYLSEKAEKAMEAETIEIVDWTRYTTEYARRIITFTGVNPDYEIYREKEITRGDVIRKMRDFDKYEKAKARREKILRKLFPRRYSDNQT